MPNFNGTILSVGNADFDNDYLRVKIQNIETHEIDYFAIKYDHKRFFMIFKLACLAFTLQEICYIGWYAISYPNYKELSLLQLRENR